jgi:hypothetical protein
MRREDLTLLTAGLLLVLAAGLLIALEPRLSPVAPSPRGHCRANPAFNRSVFAVPTPRRGTGGVVYRV